MVENRLANLTLRAGLWILDRVERRMAKAHPALTFEHKKREKAAVFAQGCSPYKIILLFIIGSLLGDITETIFCRITAGYWMSRSSLVWGPFSVVWGMAIALVTVLLYRYKDKPASWLFVVGTLLGGAYEYLCSVASEWSSVRFSGITATFPSTWAAVSTCCTASSGALRRWLGSNCSIRPSPGPSSGFRAPSARRLPGLCACSWWWIWRSVRWPSSATMPASRGVPAQSSLAVYLDEHYDDARCRRSTQGRACGLKRHQIFWYHSFVGCAIIILYEEEAVNL